MSTLLVDLTGIFRQAWHACTNREVNAAVEIVMAKLAKYWFDYDNVKICVDSPPYERNKIWPEYKANREPPSEEMQMALDELRKQILARGFDIYSCEGWEADDVIATLANSGIPDGKATILSSDKDLIPIIGLSPEFTWTSPSTGESLTEETLLAKYGCTTKEFEFILALVGGHDNIPGVKGIGFKTACQIAKYGTDVFQLRGALESQNDLPKAQLLEENLDKIELWHNLVGLNYYLEGLVVEEGVAKELPVAEEPQHEQPPPSMEQSTPPPSRMSGRDWANALEPFDPESARVVSKWLYGSKLFEKFKSPQGVLAAIMMGRNLGLPGSVASLHALSIFRGQLTIRTETMLSLVLRSGKADFLKVVESTDKQCTVKTHRKSDPDPDPVIATFSMDDIKRLEVNNAQYKKQPATMLKWRAFAKIIREVYPDVTLGLYATEEME